MKKLKRSFKSLSEHNHHHHSNIVTNPEEERQILLTHGVVINNHTDTSLNSTSTSIIDPMTSPLSSTSSSPANYPYRREQPHQESSAPTSNGGRIWRDSSYDFTKDPASKDKAKASGVSSNNNKEMEFDFITPESASPSPLRSPLSRIVESPNHYGQISPREVRVSFNENVAPDPVRRRSNANGSGGEPEEGVVSSTSSSFRRKSSVLMTKQKSRLMDPPEQDQQQQQLQKHKTRVLRSGGLGKPGEKEIDEDDPFQDDDLPDEYRKMKLFSPLTVVEILSLVSLVAGLVCTLTIKSLRKKSIFDLELWKWEVMVLVLICGRLVSGWGIRVVVFFIERNFLLRKRVVYFVYGLRNSVQNCVWLALVLVAWKLIFDKKVEKMTNRKVLSYVTRIWVCLLVGTFFWLLKTLLVKVLAMSFHVSAFFDRIQESLFNQYVIEMLSGPPLIEIQQEQEEEERVMAEVQKLQSAGAKLPADLKANLLPKMIGTPRTPWKSPSGNAKSPVFSRIMSRKEQEESGISIDQLHRLNQKNISAWNMKRLMNIVRMGVFSTLDEQLHESAGQDESSGQITSEKQAKAAAKNIFSNVAKRGSKFIFLEDLMRFLRQDEAMKMMRFFEGGSENKGISKRSLKNWVVNVFRERRALALSLNDTKTAVNKLHHMLNGLVVVIIVIIWLLILKVATTQFFILVSSQVVLVAFMFGNTAKTTFEAIIFLFVMHPYDVGDRIEIEGVQMIVEEMNILTTVFLRYDNQKIIYPNSVLSTKPISNYYRSPDMGDAIDFAIHISTPTEKIVKMKDRITRYIEGKDDHWYPAPMIVMRDVEDLNRIKWSVWPSHRMNFQDMGERWVRRALLVEEMVKIFRELDIEYRMLPMDVNVRNMPALTSTRLPSNWTACI